MSYITVPTITSNIYVKINFVSDVLFRLLYPSETFDECVFSDYRSIIDIQIKMSQRSAVVCIVSCVSMGEGLHEPL